MRPSSFISSLRNILGPLIGNDFTEKDTDDQLFISIRRSFLLCHFNVIRSEALLSPPLEPYYDQVPQIHYPFMDLPVEKLEALTGILRRYLDRRFVHTEVELSNNFWLPILDSLFPDIASNSITAEYSLKDIERSYPDLKVDFCVCVRTEMSRGLLRCPLLFVELSREPLTDPSAYHKDDVKIGYAMAASMTKLMSVTWGRGIDFLRRLRIYGILGGATDFDVCCIFPVFPNDDSEEFYFVLSSSRRHLRFHVLETNSESTLFCAGSEESITRSELNYRGTPRVPVRINLTSEQSSAGGGAEAHYLFRYGSVNSKALQVLEQVSRLVVRQAELIGELDPTEFRYFKYDLPRISLMKSGRSSHSKNTPKDQLKRYRSDPDGGYSPSHSPSTRTRGGRARNLLMDLKSFDKENLDTALFGANRPSRSVSKSKEMGIFVIEKVLADHEARIYNTPPIKDSPLFPKLFECRLILENCTTEFKFEELEAFEAVFEEDDPDLGLCKMAVDIIGAIRTLHRAGYVHGDITPWNLGYSPVKNLWNLFDFNNSRTIAAGLKGAHGYLGSYQGTDGFESELSVYSGRYTQIDDYIGFAKTLKYLMEDEEFDFSDDTVRNVFHLLDPLLQNSYSLLKSLNNDEFFDCLYCDSVKLLWEMSKNPNEESIKCAIDILESISISND